MSTSSRTRFRFKAPHTTPKPLSKANLHEETAAGLPSEAPKPTFSPNPRDPSDISDQEVTFSESLFDALTSIESAEYWAAVYGQPIHIYPRPSYISSDDEYVLYVQSKVWSKTREGVESSARKRMRKRAREEKEAQEENNRRREDARRELKDRRRAERDQNRNRQLREDREWERRISQYIHAWAGKEIPWPVAEEWGNTPIKVEQIQEFFLRLADTQRQAVGDVIKIERVRWHPDKIMQKFGVKNDTEHGREDLRRVNEVWRAIDGMWRRLREESDDS